MTVREYIGARYVPLLMGEWSDQNAYEPLSIVVNQGNSYTSRQAVPIGIPITNEQYWALTGNYNAQVEQYRREVAAISDRIEDTSFGFSNVSEMAASTDIFDGAICRTLGFHAANDGGGAYYQIVTGETPNGIDIIECSNDLQAQLMVFGEVNALQLGCKNDESADTSGILNFYFEKYPNWCIYFPSGIYRIDGEVDTLGSVKMAFDAYLKASTTLQCCVHVNKNYEPGTGGGFPYEWQHDMVLDINVDCDKKASTGIRTDQLNWAQCDFTVLNPVVYGVHTGYTTSAGHAENNFKIKVVCDKNFVNNAVGLYSASSDETFDDLYFDNTRKGVYSNASACVYKNVHHWLATPANWEGSVVFEVASPQKTVIDFLYIDTAETGIKYSGTALNTGMTFVKVVNCLAAMNFTLIPQETCESYNLIDYRGTLDAPRKASSLIIDSYIGGDAVTAGAVRFAGNGICPFNTKLGYANDYRDPRWKYSLDYAPEGSFFFTGDDAGVLGLPSDIIVGVWIITTRNASYGKVQEISYAQQTYGDSNVNLSMPNTNPVSGTPQTFYKFYRRTLNKFGTGYNSWGVYWSSEIKAVRN